MLVNLSDERRQKLAVDTLDELEWCLEQLDTVQTHRSVSDMATSKVRRRYFTTIYVCMYHCISPSVPAIRPRYFHVCARVTFVKFIDVKTRSRKKNKKTLKNVKTCPE